MSAENITDVDKVELLCELVRQSLELWQLEGDAVRAGNVIALSIETSIVIVRHDPGNAVASWWIARHEAGVEGGVREKPCNSSLAVLTTLRRTLSSVRIGDGSSAQA